MTSILRESWSNAVQIGALPLTVLGVVMAWIEVRRPPLAARVTSVLLEMGRIRFGGLPVQGTGKMALRLFTLVHATVLVAFWVWFVLVGAAALRTSPFHRLAWGVVALVLPVGAAFLFVRAISWLLRGLASFCRGRAFGAMGLLLAVIGLMAELYQVAVLFR